MMAAKALTTRWNSSPEARRAYERIVKTLISGGEITAKHSPFEPVDGRIDLRGFQLEEHQRRVVIKGVRGKGIDLSGCRLNWVWLEGCRFEDVDFGMADLSQISDLGNAFHRCSFAATDFRDGGLGYDGSSYVDCNFEATDFRRAVFTRAEFDRCRFINCRLKGIDFNASSFEGCTFVGMIQHVWFRGGFALESDVEEFGKPRRNRMRSVSFERAELWGLTLSDDCDLSTIRMPLEGDYRLYPSWKQRLKKLQEAFPSWALDEQEAADRFVYVYSGHAKKQNWFLLNVDEIKEKYGELLTAKFLEVLDAPV